MCTRKIVELILLLALTSFTGAKEDVNRSSQHDFLIVSLEGKTVDQFSTIQSDFKLLIAQLTAGYCEAVGYQGCESVNSSTVEINSVQQCSPDLPDSDLCININLSVPINSTELNYRHLRAMWQTHSTSQLSLLGLQEYTIPSSSAIFIAWLGITGLLFFLFIIMLVLVLKTKVIENYIRRRMDIIGSSNRSWLAKHGEKQLVPPLFYSDPIITLEEINKQLGTKATNMQQCFGIENPVYDPELKEAAKTENEHFETNQETKRIVHDVDSDEETIYPQSPRPKLVQHM